MKLFILFAVVCFMAIGCAAPEATVTSKYNFDAYSRTGEMPLDSLLLTLEELPEGYSFGTKPIPMDIQTAILYESPMMYEPIIGGGSLKGKAYQTIIGPNDKGSVLFLYYGGVLHPNSKGFLGGLLWGESKPTNMHPEEFFVNNNIIVIWSFPRRSTAKDLSQEKISKFLSRLKM